jgi:hypothetical protein
VYGHPSGIPLTLQLCQSGAQLSEFRLGSVGALTFGLSTLTFGLSTLTFSLGLLLGGFGLLLGGFGEQGDDLSRRLVEP